MSGFIYFVETEEPITRLSSIQSLGLGYAFDALPVVSLVKHGTPSKYPGTFICDESRLGDYSNAYHPSQQTWRKFLPEDGKPPVWVGYYNDAKPTPYTLQRDALLPGLMTRLQDGHDWQVPIVYLYEGTGERCVLPRYVDVDMYGRTVQGETLAKYAFLLDAISPFWQAYCTAYQEALDKHNERFTIPCPTADADAATVLSANYVVSLREIAMLQLFASQQTAGEILSKACDCASAAEFFTYQWSQKKTESES